MCNTGLVKKSEKQITLDLCTFECLNPHIQATCDVFSAFECLNPHIQATCDVFSAFECLNPHIQATCDAFSAFEWLSVEAVSMYIYSIIQQGQMGPC